ncbi:MAG: acyl carrier protein [Desulfobacteraceae bacterium]|jgi:acyl carrier protein
MKINAKLKNFIIAEYLLGTQINELSDDLNLVENGIIDSLALLKLVAYIENEFNIVLEPEEIDMDNLNSIQAITAIIGKKVNQMALPMSNIQEG